MPARAVDVEWEVATDEAFTRIERRGMTTAVPELAHSVHVDLAGLRPGADYFYRFGTAGHVSPAGRVLSWGHRLRNGRTLWSGAEI
jgi:alkaline phosphatase D